MQLYIQDDSYRDPWLPPASIQCCLMPCSAEVEPWVKERPGKSG